MKKFMPFIKYQSLQNSSILVRFHIFFFVMTIIPVLLLAYLFTQFRETGHIDMTVDDFGVALFLTVLGIIGGYISMRVMLRNLIDVTQANAEKIRGILGPQKVRDFLKGSNDEIRLLTNTFHEVTSRLEEDITTLEVTKKTLQSVLTRVGQGMASRRDVDTFFDLIMETVTEALGGKRGFLFLLNEKKTAFTVKAVYGVKVFALPQKFLELSTSPFAQVLEVKAPLVIPKAQYLDASTAEGGDLDYPIICAPLMLGERVLGAIVVSGRKVLTPFHEEEMMLLFNVAAQVAIAAENAEKNIVADRTYFETLSALAMAIEAKDLYARGHLERVEEYAVVMARYLGLDDKVRADLSDAARIHDVGKIGVPDDVLTKVGPLNEQEWVMMKRHPEIGENIIKSIVSLQSLRDIIRHHHEKLDGSGYPDGLKGDEIGLPVRILTIADIYASLTSDRPYRKAVLPDQALRMMRDMGGEIDQGVVSALKECIIDRITKN